MRLVVLHREMVRLTAWAFPGAYDAEAALERLKPLQAQQLIEILGAAIGAGIGAMTGSLTDVGIDDSFIAGVKDRVKPGTSALFLLTSNAVVDRIEGVFEGSGAELIASNLSREQEDKLREVFSAD